MISFSRPSIFRQSSLFLTKPPLSISSVLDTLNLTLKSLWGITIHPFRKDNGSLNKTQLMRMKKVISPTQICTSVVHPGQHLRCASKGPDMLKCFTITKRDIKIRTEE